MNKSPKFPSQDLVSAGGEIYAHIFENDRTGLARNLFWSVTINFEPISYLEEPWACSMTCEWIPWALRQWRGLSGKQLDVKELEDGIESSFYLAEHHWGTHTRMWIASERDNLFRVRMQLTVDFAGLSKDDGDPAMPVAAEAIVPFTGVLIMPDSINPKPNTVGDIKTVAASFVELSAYDDPVPYNELTYVLKPRL